MKVGGQWLAWPISPGNSPHSRPWCLYQELKLDLLADLQRVYHHGRSPSTADGTAHRVSFIRIAAKSPPMAGAGAVLSPVLLRPFAASARWIDLYDDWSIAPDIHPVMRALAANGYRSVRERTGVKQLVTVNSPYMRAKMLPRVTRLVPNGVDPALAKLTLGGDDRPRLIIMGNFHRGRTDFRLLAAALASPVLSEILLVGARPGSRAEALGRAAAANSAPHNRITLLDHTPMHALAPLIGANTLALVPHVVSDYTLSQDLMKVYQFLGLGVPTLAPRALWPRPIPLDFGHLLEVGVELEDVLRHALRQAPPSSDWRRQFVQENSWTARANLIRMGWD